MIAIDIGNTSIKAGVFENEELVSVFRFEDVDGLWMFCTNLPVDTSIIISSVTNSDLNSFYRYFPKLMVLDYQTKVPIVKKYKTPETLGNDRLAAAVGAYYLHPNSNNLTIDAGTAIKYEFINDKGEYEGGSISAGVDMKFKALNVFTGKLPLIEKRINFEAIGNTTETALRSGVLFGTQLEMQGFIDHYSSLYTNLQVILTGGDHTYFADRLKGTIFAEPNLVLKGLFFILKYNAAKV